MTDRRFSRCSSLKFQKFRKNFSPPVALIYGGNHSGKSQRFSLSTDLILPTTNMLKLAVLLTIISLSVGSDLCFTSCASLCGDATNVDFHCSSGVTLGINGIAECKCANGTKFTCDSRFCDQKCHNKTQFKCETASHPTCMCTTGCKAELWCSRSCNGNYEYTCANNQEMCSCIKSPLAQTCDRDRCDKGCKGKVQSYTCDDTHENCKCAMGSYSLCYKEGCNQRCKGHFHYSCGFGNESNCTCEGGPVAEPADNNKGVGKFDKQTANSCQKQMCREHCKDDKSDCINDKCECGYGSGASGLKGYFLAATIGSLIVLW